MGGNRIPLASGNYYHIFNRGNNREDVFIQARNYEYFMELWWKHTFSVAETYAYCLLRNHFHAVVSIRDRDDQAGSADGRHIPGRRPSRLRQPSQYFSNLFNAYARGVNNAVQRTGALFERPFERLLITNESYLMRVMVYVHQNPRKHKFVEDFRDWNYSSYHELTGSSPTRLPREKVMALFGGREGFIRVHEELESAAELEA